ncbi:MAG: bifunctional demethylmenaquinone methyltransferase/2-methoxy-6-polyprenyl-1,4-benzoquinol methylase UbiE [Planctomycetaceae bacterium]|nr:bifunctional demethylmenaquinone methyltransferase/2-methoxy-6-polyprenyl-1,4-benzoquinol methylase UbiE [Planctomycetaceae bacterium]
MTVDKSEKRIQQMFGEISPRYDFLNHFLSGGTDYYWRWRAVRAVPPGEGPILDVCTGTGDLAIAYWKKRRGRVRVVGSDFTHEMLRIAREKALKSNNGEAASLSFIEADTQKLPFPDDEFQIVSVAFGLRNVTHTEKGLQEMVRVCKPGGKVLVLEFSMPRNRLIGGFYRWYFRNILPRIGQLLARNRQSAYNYLPQSVSEFPHGQALADLMESAGLEQVTFKPLTFGIASMYWGTKPSQKNSDYSDLQETDAVAHSEPLPATTDN